MVNFIFNKKYDMFNVFKLWLIYKGYDRKCFELEFKILVEIISIDKDGSSRPYNFTRRDRMLYFSWF